MQVAVVQAERIAVEQPTGSTTRCCSCPLATRRGPSTPERTREPSTQGTATTGVEASSDGDHASRDRP